MAIPSKLKYDVGEIDRLEQENRKLKNLIGQKPKGLEVIRDIRGITLSRENQTLQEILLTYARLGVKDGK
jgi:hypothetical protein